MMADSLAKVVFLVEASPDPQTVSALLEKDRWTEHGFTVSVEQYWQGIPLPESAPVQVNAFPRIQQGACAYCVERAKKAGRVAAGESPAGWDLRCWRRRLIDLGATVVVVGSEVLHQGRAAVMAANSLGIPSVQLQHGFPMGWWGYVPTLTTRIFSWGRLSSEQFISFGVDPERIVETGSPRFAHLLDGVERRKAQIKQLRECRGLSEDAVVVLAAEGYRGYSPSEIDGFCQVVFEVLETCDDVHFLVKVHPAESVDSVRELYARAIAAFPGRVHVHLLELGEALAVSDFGFTYKSTTGLEAAGVGLPMASFVPQTSARTDEAEQGSFGLPAVHSGAEMIEFLREPRSVSLELVESWFSANPQEACLSVFAQLASLVHECRGMTPSAEIAQLMEGTPCSDCHPARRRAFYLLRRARRAAARIARRVRAVAGDADG